MNNTMRLACLSALTFATSMLSSPNASFAQRADPQLAAMSQALFEQAVAEMAERKYASACKKLEEVTRLAPEALGAKLELAHCYDQLGRLASAWSQYSLVEQLAERAGQEDRATEDRATEAGRRAADLRPKLATITVNVPASVRKLNGIEISRDRLPLGEAQWNTELPVDVGPHEITASAPGYLLWKKTTEVVMDGAHITVVIDALIKDPKGPQKPASRTTDPVVVVAPPDRSWQKPMGITATAMGGTSVLAGLIVGRVAISTKDEAYERNLCNEFNFCNAEGLQLRKQAVKMGDAATGLVVAGSVIGVGGVVLWVLAPKAPADKPKATGRLTGIAFAQNGISLSGEW
jgi:hypothetical protein